MAEFGPVTTESRRSAVIAVVVLLLILVAGFWLMPSGGTRYRAQIMVLAKPYTNAIFARVFETQVLQTIPGVFALRVAPTFSGIPRAGTTSVTNGCTIHIFACGPTAADAEGAASNAALAVCQMVRTNYNGTGSVLQRASNVRRYSFLRDGLRPAIGRWFEP